MFGLCASALKAMGLAMQRGSRVEHHRGWQLFEQFLDVSSEEWRELHQGESVLSEEGKNGDDDDGEDGDNEDDEEGEDGDDEDGDDGDHL